MSKVAIALQRRATGAFGRRGQEPALGWGGTACLAHPRNLVDGKHAGGSEQINDPSRSSASCV